MDGLNDDSSDCSSCASLSFIDDGVEYLKKMRLLEKYIIHVDVDCFYCQTEELRNPALARRPLAIGQKHIIVTSNYVARKMGVKKLQRRVDALRQCPDLVIVEGSDLEPYRDASRLIYIAFRAAVAELSPKNAARKGGMDEYFADLTVAVDNEWNHGKDKEFSTSSQYDGEPVWIYGDNLCEARITEDQSGATTRSVWTNGDGQDEHWGTLEEKKSCITKFKIAARFARQIQSKIMEETGFTTTVGVSSSPMLSKLASDLHKPKSCNILYPWRSTNMIASMPLRRIPDLGSTTLRSMEEVLKQYNGDKEFWTCNDLLNVPRHAVKYCLKRDKTGNLCDLLLNRCRGIDTATIVDDGGCLAKTVSVEDSFIRGSLTSMKDIMKNLRILFIRLLSLLDKRKMASDAPEKAYPRVIRLSARIVDRSVTTNRRAFRNISKQAILMGKSLIEIQEENARIRVLKRCTDPLLQIFSELTIGLNVTRLNLAAVSFADLDGQATNEKYLSGKALGSKQSVISSFFQQSRFADATTLSAPSENCNEIITNDVDAMVAEHNYEIVKDTDTTLTPILTPLDKFSQEIFTSNDKNRCSEDSKQATQGGLSWKCKTMNDVIQSLKRKHEKLKKYSNAPSLHKKLKL